MKTNENEDIRKLQSLPLFIRKSKRTEIKEQAKSTVNKYCRIVFYQTNAFTPYSHYKAISKIFTIKYGEPE